ncbi:uncharacterized protein LOC110943825 [Helianthus annuus]|uniref:uncharacterized protein LOC110943825 n=1 Tax=Helianthus annuus TaxID=4232 RepID=UPI001652E4EE|nr:uncharacterized protein LOC110943825 [Helianthus annuus]
MSSFWKDNYFGNRYSNDTWGSNAANEEEEVVSGVPVDQETQLPDLNKTPTPPVDEPNYPVHQVCSDYGYGYESPYVQQSGYGAENAPVDEPNYPVHQVCPDYGYGYESPYVQQSGYGAENAPVDEPYYPSQPSYPGYGVYGDEGGYGSYSGYGGDGGYGGEGGYSGYGGYSVYDSVYDRYRDEVGYGYESRNTSLYEPSTPSNPFQVNERFMSLTDLKNWVQETGKDNGYVIVTRRSKNIGGTTGMVWLVCDRSGEHRSKATVRKAGSKKIGCPFSLLAIRDVTNDTWELKVDCANHNHEPTTSLLGHAFVRRFTKAEYKLVEQLTAQNMEPRIIFQTLRKQFPDSLHVQKDVQNAVQKIRATIMDGKNPIQALESLLHDRRFIYDTRQDPKTDVVTEIFFVHPYSITMWRAFPHVMLIDATYKTNLYNMPFVQVVGMTSTGKSFCIAHAVICKERRGNYVWVLERIKSILHECMMSRVIVTDRELALINACSKVFPNAKRLLCHFHIQQNIARKCKEGFDKEDWGKFMSYWRTLCESSSEPMYKYNLEKMYNRLVVANRESVYDYVYENWLKDYKEMFVYAWTDKCRNFGQRTTNRVESQHANLKRYITRGSSLERIARCIIDIVETQYDEIQKSFTESIEKTMNHHRHRMLDNLRGKVSHEALDLLEKELLRKMDVLRKLNASCGCHMWLSKGLPCACRLENYNRTGRIIQLDEIDVFWRKLDLLPCKLVDEEVDIVAELNNVRQHLEAQSPVQQKICIPIEKTVRGGEQSFSATTVSRMVYNNNDSAAAMESLTQQLLLSLLVNKVFAASLPHKTVRGGEQSFSATTFSRMVYNNNDSTAATESPTQRLLLSLLVNKVFAASLPHLSDDNDEGDGQTTQEHYFMPSVENPVGSSSQFVVGDDNNDGFDDSKVYSTEDCPHDDPQEDTELRDYICPDYEDNPMDIWNPKAKHIRLGLAELKELFGSFTGHRDEKRTTGMCNRSTGSKERVKQSFKVCIPIEKTVRGGEQSFSATTFSRMVYNNNDSTAATESPTQRLLLSLLVNKVFAASLPHLSDDNDEGDGQTTQEHYFMPSVENPVGSSSQFVVGDDNNDGFDDSKVYSTEDCS